MPAQGDRDEGVILTKHLTSPGVQMHLGILVARELSKNKQVALMVDQDDVVRLQPPDRLRKAAELLLRTGLSDEVIEEVLCLL